MIIGDDSEGRGAKDAAACTAVVANLGETAVIEGVERLQPYLEAGAFAEFYILKQQLSQR